MFLYTNNYQCPCFLDIQRYWVKVVTIMHASTNNAILISHCIWTTYSSTGLQSLTFGNWWRLLELLCWSKTLRGNLTAPLTCFWKLGKTFSLCWLVLVPESSSAGGWTRRRRYGEKTMRLLADATMAVKLRLKSRITNLCASILLLSWSVWRFSRFYLGGWYKCGGNSLAAGRRWVWDQDAVSAFRAQDSEWSWSCGYSSGFPTWWDTLVAFDLLVCHLQTILDSVAPILSLSFTHDSALSL